MANWEKLRYVVRVRPDDDHGSVDQCNDSLDEVEVTINGSNRSPRETELQLSVTPNGYQLNSIVSQSQPYLNRRYCDSLYLSVPQNIGRKDEGVRTLLPRTPSTNSLVNGSDIDGEASSRSHLSWKKRRKDILRELFSRQERQKSYLPQVRKC